MENSNVLNDTQQTVVESAAAECENGGASDGTLSESTQTDIAPRKQSAAQNSGFRKLRLENEQYKKQIEEFSEKLKDLESLEALKSQNEIYLNRLVEDKMSKDLEAIRKIDPTLKDLHSLGGDFIRLIENGVDATLAYHAVKRATEGKVTPKPPTTGAVGSAGPKQSEFYSSRELDRLTAKDLENPAVFKKAMESLKRL